MDDRTLTALKESIAHWTANVAAETWKEASTGAFDCALCKIFNNGPILERKECIGCPVRQKTGRRYCERTPYYRADASLNVWSNNPDSQSAKATWRLAAQRELDFLIGLLPPEHVEPERVSNEAAE